MWNMDRRKLLLYFVTFVALPILSSGLVEESFATCSWTVQGKHFDYSSLKQAHSDYSCLTNTHCSSDGNNYFVGICDNAISQACIAGGVSSPVCQAASGNRYFSCGSIDDPVVSAIDDSDVSKGLKIKYNHGSTCHPGTGQEHERSSELWMECGEDKGLYSEQIDPSDDCKYILKFSSPKACSGAHGGGDDDDEKKCNFGCHFANFLGWLFLILMFNCTGLGITLYLIIGSLVQAFLRKPPRRGMDIIPTKDFIFSIPFVFKDSFVFVYTYTIGLLYKLIMENIVNKKGGGGSSSAPSKSEYEQFD